MWGGEGESTAASKIERGLSSPLVQPRGFCKYSINSVIEIEQEVGKDSIRRGEGFVLGGGREEGYYNYLAYLTGPAAEIVFVERNTKTQYRQMKGRG